MTLVHVAMPAKGVTPETIVSTGNGSVFVGDKSVGRIVRAVEARHDEIIVELDVEEAYVEHVRTDWDRQFCGFRRDEDGVFNIGEHEHRASDEVVAVFHKGKHYSTLQEALKESD